MIDEETEKRLYQVSAILILSIVAALLLYFYIYNQGFVEGENEGYDSAWDNYEKSILDSVEGNYTLIVGYNLIKCEEANLDPIVYGGWIDWTY